MAEPRTEYGLSQYLSKLDDKQKFFEPKAMYASAVRRSLDRPVISADAAGKMLGFVPYHYADERGYITPRQYAQAAADAVALSQMRTLEESGKLTDAAIRKVQSQRQELGRIYADGAGGVLAGTLTKGHPVFHQMAGDMRKLVASHATGRENAALAHRTESEDAALRNEYGVNAEFMLTEAGRRNHDAGRVADLWSARDENYQPASFMAQTQRVFAPIFAYPWNAIKDPYNAVFGNVNRNAGEPWDEFAMIQKPDGKLEYAAHMYARGNADEGKQGPVSVYDPEGRAKYGQYDPSGNPVGLINVTTENQSYPLAFVAQNFGTPIKEMGTHIGNYLAGGDSNHLDNIRQLRAASMRTTPVVPDHIDPREFDKLGKQVQGSVAALSGFNSATLGPKFADAWNATPLGRVLPTPRTYLSPLAQSVVETPGEMVADPVNLVANLGGAGLGAAWNTAKSAASTAARSGIRSAVRNAAGDSVEQSIRSLARLPVRYGSDMIEEAGLEGPVTSTAMTGLQGLGSYVAPEKDNMLMGDRDPNSPGFDQAVEEASTDARQQQFDAARRYGELMGKKPKPSAPSPDTRTPWVLPHL